jgi:thioredoxin 1
MGGNLTEFTDANWNSEVLESPIPVLVDFWAPWCQPCLRLTPTIEKLAAEYGGKVKVGKLNIDENQETAVSQHVSSIPTVLLLKDGKVVDRLVGLNSEGKYKSSIHETLGVA